MPTSRNPIFTYRCVVQHGEWQTQAMPEIDDDKKGTPREVFNFPDYSNAEYKVLKHGFFLINWSSLYQCITLQVRLFCENNAQRNGQHILSVYNVPIIYLFLIRNTDTQNRSKDRLQKDEKTQGGGKSDQAIPAKMQHCCQVKNLDAIT